MIIEVDNERVFIPVWNGNAESDEPIKITHRFLKAGERNKFIYTKPLRMSSKTGEVLGELEYVQDLEGICKTLIKKIESLDIKDNKSGAVVKVETATALYNTPGVPSGLMMEIETYFLTASPEVDGDFL